MPYTVHLEDHADATNEDVLTVVTRFRRELERKLGDETASAIRALQSASGSSANALTTEVHRLASAYRSAYEAARTAGFRDLGNVQGAFVDVRLA